MSNEKSNEARIKNELSRGKIKSDNKEKLPCDECGEENNSTNSAAVLRKKQHGDPREIPPEIRKFFEKIPNTTPFEHINYTRIVRVDLCPRNHRNTYDLTVKKFEFDFGVFGEIMGIPDRVLFRMAYLAFEALKAKDVKLCERSTKERTERRFSFSRIMKGILLQNDFGLSSSERRGIIKYLEDNYGIKNPEKLLEYVDQNIGLSDVAFGFLAYSHISDTRAFLEKVDASRNKLEDELAAANLSMQERQKKVKSLPEKLAKIRDDNLAEIKKIARTNARRTTTSFFRGIDKVYRPVPSSFDINFYSATAVVFRSNVRHLRFMPEPFDYTNSRDKIYYRNEFVSEDFTWCSFVNAWDNGVVDDRLPCKTPFNQEHKIDLSMVLCVYANSQDLGNGKANPKWFFTPIKIDPPHQNGGKG